MPSNIKNIVIVGGGTSGWLSAAFLAKTLSDSYLGEFKLSLIESSDIPTIGVGEATTPSLQLTLQSLGVDEFEFMRECDATFKHGIRFSQWRRSTEEQPDEYYFHPFQSPLRVGIDQSARHWANTHSDEKYSFAEAVGTQQTLAEKGYSPKLKSAQNFGGPLPYAYHLDAGKLAVFLKKIAKKNDVEHIIGEVSDTEIKAGHITSLILKDGSRHETDLVIDCTGFAAKFINHDKTNPFIDKSHQLFCDRAVATRIEIPSISDIVPYTKSTAQESGWIWDINLTERRGVGHVYSSRHCSEEQALDTLAQYVGVDSRKLEHRQLRMRIGYHEKQWRGNCVAIGLSAGFLEPLESTGIYLTEMAVWMLGQKLPRFFSENTPIEKPEEGKPCSNNQDAAPTAARFNFMMGRHFENIVDFIKAHYYLSGRQDSDFWRENTNPATAPESLKELLNRWKKDYPGDYDFDSNIVCFNSENYQYILYGMQAPYRDPARNHSRTGLFSKRSDEIMKTLHNRRLSLIEQQQTYLMKNTKAVEKVLGYQVEQNAQRKTSTFAPQSGSNYKLR